MLHVELSQCVDLGGASIGKSNSAATSFFFLFASSRFQFPLQQNLRLSYRALILAFFLFVGCSTGRLQIGRAWCRE